MEANQYLAKALTTISVFQANNGIGGYVIYGGEGGVEEALEAVGCVEAEAQL